MENRLYPGGRSLLATLFWQLLGLILIALFISILLHNPGLRSRAHGGVILALSFALFAYLVKGVSFSGASVGALLSLVLYVSSGLPGFGALLCVFAITWVATKSGEGRKRQLGIAERSQGRTAAQVLANIWISVFAAALSVISPWGHTLRIASLAALAEAASDTASSELGQAFGKRARLITNGRAVPIGTDGGISLVGVFAGLLAALLVALESHWTGQAEMHAAGVIVVSGFLGMIFDSFLGALLERKGWLTNNGVNLASTWFSALLAILLTCI